MNTNIKSVLFLICAIVLVAGFLALIPSTTTATSVVPSCSTPDTSCKSWSKDPFGIVAFVNSKMGYVIPSEGSALNFDAATALKVCQLAGCNTVISMNSVSWYDGGRSGWYSCGDNTLAKWNTSTNAFEIKPACSLGNIWLSSLVCGKAACSTNSDCGTSAYTGNAYCNGSSVYQNYITYTCNNPGKDNASCSNATAAKLKTTCSAGQTCSNGACITVACTQNSDCGTSGYTGSAYCNGGNVYQNYITYTCNNAGTANATCSNATTAKLTTTCSGNQTCTNGACVNQTITCSASSECGTSGYIGSPFCNGGDVYKTYKTYTCNNAGTPSSYCSTSQADKLVTDCTTGQTCSNGSCANQPITCSASSECGTSGYVGSPFCSGGDVYKTYRTYTCNNAGTVTSYCSTTSADKLVTDCTANQVCSNGSCADQEVTCDTSSDCGTSGYIGSPFCSGGDVYKTYRTYTCNNAGTPSSTCSSSTSDKLFQDCGTSKTCSSGSCVDQEIACNSTSDCGTSGYVGDAFCSGGDVYKTYRTYTCNNAGTPSSTCSSSTSDKLMTDCTTGQTCSNGTCQNQNISCSSSSDCGNSGYVGDSFCSGGDVYKTYRTYTCNNAGTSSSYCSTSSSDKLMTDCASGQTCSNGSCGSNCTYHSYQQCSGNYLYWFNSCGVQEDLIQYCSNGCSNNSCNTNNLTVQTNSATNTNNNQATLNGYVYGISNYNGSAYSNNTVWFQWGTTTSYGNETTHQTMNYSGSFSQLINLYSNNATYHYRAVAQNNNGNTVYGQDMTFTTGTTTGTLSVAKTVRNLSTGTGFANSVSASPSDVLMFMITVQATGNQDINNAYVRDTLPANLIYKNNLVVSGTSNYSGDINSGMNFGTITAGQTITITYQAQVAPASNFSYGTTTLTNSVSVTSSNTNYTPTSNASVFVTRTAVYGASTISTGLTNRFWVDSFFLPLMIALGGIWMLRSGMFFGIEKWFDNSKRKGKDYKAQKELDSRIAEIKKLEKVEN